MDADGVIFRPSGAYSSFENAKTAVFWDVNDCQIPNGLSPVKVSDNIWSALAKLNYRGPAEIFAYGDINQIRQDPESGITTVSVVPDEVEGHRLDREVMNYRPKASIWVNGTTTMVVNYTPAGSKDARLEMIFVDMLIWAIKNPSPSVLVLLLGDFSEHMEFVLASNCLGAEGYKLSFAMPRNTAPPLGVSVQTTLLWESLSYGEILKVKVDK